MKEMDVLTFLSETGILPRGVTFADRYTIVERLGQGGVGTVYVAQDELLKETVALKLLKPNREYREDCRDRFLRETRIARTLSHDNIVRIFDIGSVQSVLYISMEYIDGHDLKYYIRGNIPLGDETRRNIVAQILEGLRYAHSKGVVHRDIKSQNIMIRFDDVLKILDFGLAKLKNQDGMTIQGAIMGTPEYMSPEQALGKPLDHRSDIYSLGVVLYELFTGTLPFSGLNPVETLNMHVNMSPPDPYLKNISIPRLIRRIILKCLEKEPKDRYQSVEEIIHTLQQNNSPQKLVVGTAQTAQSENSGQTIVGTQTGGTEIEPVVLLVDDDVAFLETIKDYLTLLKTKILTASNPDKALEIIKKQPVSVVVSDFDMVPISGVAFLEKVHAIQSQTKRLLLTGKPTLDVAVSAINKGSVHKFFTKPVKGKELLETIRSLIQEYITDQAIQALGNAG